jgi:type I restriction enzyme S subunit
VSRHESYRPVRSFWIDEVPTHWRTVRNKQVLFHHKEIVGEKWGSFVLLTMGKSGVKPRDLDAGGKFPESFDTYQKVKPNQLIFCLFDLDETPRTVGLSSRDGMITSAYDVFSLTDNNDPQYWTYFYQAIDDRKGLRPYYTGLRKVVRSDTFMSIEVYSPPLHEQQLISRYLDKKTAQIDSLIEKIKKKIELLKDQRTSLINQCITKGLDPKVEMKDSGVEWIGKIPKHWKISKYKYEITIQNGYPFKSELFDNENGYPLIRIRDVTSGSIETFYTGEPLPEFTVKNGDLLIGMDGDFNVRWWLGPDALLNQRVCRVFNGERLNRRYVSYMLPFQLKVINDLTYFTTVKHLSSFGVLEARTLVPPISEQTEIAKFLNSRTKEIDRVIVFESERVLLLSEYRQSLISSVVTGKIRITEDMV